MAGRIVQADVEEVKARTNIADIIGERVSLRSAGVGSMKGLCPFHDEKSPSFHVRPQLGYYHCFGCGESGDVYSFLRAMDHMTFTEVVERLAARLGYQLRYEDGGPVQETSGRTRLLKVNSAAAEYFRSQLVTPEAESARRFLGERGFDAGAAAHFGVGYAPRGWDHLRDALRAQGFTEEEMLSAGVLSQGNRAPYDRFRGRVIWPIRDVAGQTIGFGARKLYEDDQGPKYLNTPETIVYKKNQVLYGLDLAKKDMSRGDVRRAVIVEGYTDVMACHMAGVTTAIATCGTAFGSEHVTVLRRVMGDESASGEVVFTFDPDAAGQKAAIRAFAEQKRFNAQTFVAVAPDGLDPCDLRLTKGDAAVRALLETKMPMFEFVIDQKIAPYDLSTVEGRAAALRQAAPIVAEIQDRMIRSGYERVLAGRLGIDPRDVQDEIRGVQRRSEHSKRNPGVPAEVGAAPGSSAVTIATLSRDAATVRERDALMGILQYGHATDAELIDRALAVPFSSPALDAVRGAIAAAGERTRPGWALQAAESVREPYRVLASQLLMADFPARDEQEAVFTTERLGTELLSIALKREKAELLGQLQRVSAGSAEGREISIRLRDIENELRGLREDA